MRADLNMWKEYPNIYTDLSAIQDIDSPEDYPFPNSYKNVTIAKEILGAKRLIWGTDSPWSATFNTYNELATWLENVDIFTKEELEDVFYNNAQRVYFKPEAVKAIKESVDPATEGIDIDI